MSGGSLTPDALACAIEDAEACGYQVVRSNDTTLLLDLDSPEAVAQYDRVMPLVIEKFGGCETGRWASKSGNTHIEVTTVVSLDFNTRVALQAALGSDGVREVLNIVQHDNGCVEPSILFRPMTMEEFYGK